MKKLLFVFRALLALGLLGCVTVGWAQPVLHPSTSVDYTPIDNGTPKIVAHLSETIIANLLIDSGASRCFVADTVKDRLNLPAYAAVDSYGTPVVVAGKQCQQVKVPFLGMGLIHWADTPFILCPPESSELFSRKGAEGLIGTDILCSFATLFDTQKKQLTFWPGGELNTEDLKSRGFENAVALPLTFGTIGKDGKKEGLYRVRVRFNEKEEAEIALDTGAAQTALPRELVRKLKLKPTTKARPQETLFGPMTTNTTRLKTLTLGTLTLRDLDVQYTEGEETPGYFPHLGMDVLSHFRFLLDAPAKKLYLQPIEPPKEGKATPAHQ